MHQLMAILGEPELFDCHADIFSPSVTKYYLLLSPNHQYQGIEENLRVVAPTKKSRLLRLHSHLCDAMLAWNVSK